MKCELKYIKHEFIDTTKDIYHEKMIPLILFVIIFNLINYISNLIFGFHAMTYIGIIFIVIGLLLIYIQVIRYCKRYKTLSIQNSELNESLRRKIKYEN